MKIKLDNGAKMPTRAHQWDVGIGSATSGHIGQK